MKRLITPLLLLVCFVSFAQGGGRMMQEKIKAQKVAYITEQLNLTAEEAQNFWPIYNAFEDKMHQMRRNDMRKLRESMKDGELSENEAQKILDDFLALEDKMHSAKKQLAKDLRKVIPAKKIIKLKAAEDGFNRMLMDKLKERRQNRMKRNFP